MTTATPTAKTSADARRYWSWSRASSVASSLIAAARLINIGPTLGNILFTALPLLAAVAAVARFRHDP